MLNPKPNDHTCPVHGKPTKREECRACNAAYMRSYLRKVRQDRPDKALLERARKRARRRGIRYSLRRSDITMPTTCPVLGLPIVTGGTRASTSPSLDRIDPRKGYLPGNVRVISDKANRLKGHRDLQSIQRLSRFGAVRLRTDYMAVAKYMEREALLLEVRAKAGQPGRVGEQWTIVADFLERIFRRYPVSRGLI